MGICSRPGLLRSFFFLNLPGPCRFEFVSLIKPMFHLTDERTDEVNYLPGTSR